MDSLKKARIVEKYLDKHEEETPTKFLENLAYQMGLEDNDSISQLIEYYPGIVDSITEYLIDNISDEHAENITNQLDDDDYEDEDEDDDDDYYDDDEEDEEEEYE